MFDSLSGGKISDFRVGGEKSVYDDFSKKNNKHGLEPKW